MYLIKAFGGGLKLTKINERTPFWISRRESLAVRRLNRPNGSNIGKL
jgi:hypothetical protein